jgi:hypothetical protein
VETVTSDSSGDFATISLPDSPDYYYWIHQNSTDINGLEVGLLQVNFAIASADLALGNVEVRRAVPVSGTITNWTSAMGDLRVQVYEHVGGNWQIQTEALSDDANFSVPALLDDGDYTLYFILDTPVIVPYLDAFLGGEFFDAEDAQKVTATAGTPLTGITMTMPDAAFITGTVTDAVTGAGIPGIWVSTEDPPEYYHWDETQTDADGDYSLRAIPGLTYAVYADDWTNSIYRSMTYKNLDPCGCTFTPVEPTLADPETGIDFALIEEDDAVYIEGVLFDDAILPPASTPAPFDNVQVHLYKPVPGGWTEIDVAESDTGFFELLLPAMGSYRMRFEIGGVWLPVIDGFGDEASALFPDALNPGCFVDTGPLDAGSLDADVAYGLIAGLNQAGGCGPQPAPSGSSGGGGGGNPSGTPRSRTFTAPDGSVVVTPTPTPTPTPTSSPSPSSSPEPSETPNPEPGPETADTGFPWWIILIVLLVLGVIITIVVIIRRR